ncbi:hypothetical protein Dimus_030126 [Dionaea muscipula]
MPLSAYILNQKSLPPSYKSFLNKHGGKDMVILEGLKDITSGKPFTNLEGIEKYYKANGIDITLDPKMSVPCSSLHNIVEECHWYRKVKPVFIDILFLCMLGQSVLPRCSNFIFLPECSNFILLHARTLELEFHHPPRCLNTGARISSSSQMLEVCCAIEFEGQRGSSLKAGLGSVGLHDWVVTARAPTAPAAPAGGRCGGG